MQIIVTALTLNSPTAKGVVVDVDPATVGDALALNGYRIKIVDAPTLQGSDKQVAWAQTIRAASIEDFVRTYILGGVKVGDTTLARTSFATPEWATAMVALRSGLDKLAAKLATFSTARDWIEAANGSKSLLTVAALARK